MHLVPGAPAVDYGMRSANVVEASVGFITSEVGKTIVTGDGLR